MVTVIMGEKSKAEIYDWQDDPELTTRNEDQTSLRSLMLGFWLILVVAIAIWLLIGVFNYQTKPHQYFVAYEYSYLHGVVTGTGRRVVEHTNGPVTVHNAEEFLHEAEIYLACTYYGMFASDPRGDFAVCIVHYQEIERSPLGWIFYN